MSNRKYGSNKSSNSKGAFKYVAFWGTLLVGSFMLGFLVISPLVGLATPRSAKQTTADKVANANSETKRSPSEVIPMPAKSATIPKDEGVQITPDKSNKNGDIQKPDVSVDTQDNSTSETSNTKDKSVTKLDTNTQKRIITPDVQPSDTSDSSSTKPERNVDNGDVPSEPVKTKRVRTKKPSTDNSTDEPSAPKRSRTVQPEPEPSSTDAAPPKRARSRRNADSGSTEKKKPASTDSGVQKGEGIDR